MSVDWTKPIEAKTHHRWVKARLIANLDNVNFTRAIAYKNSDGTEIVNTCTESGSGWVRNVQEKTQFQVVVYKTLTGAPSSVSAKITEGSYLWKVGDTYAGRPVIATFEGEYV